MVYVHCILIAWFNQVWRSSFLGRVSKNYTHNYREKRWAQLTQVQIYLLRSVSEHAVNLNVERETCLLRLFVGINGRNGTTPRKWFFSFARPLCAIVLDAKCRGNC